MKIGNREITSFRELLIQIQEFAIKHPWLASIDIVIISVIIIVAGV